MKRPIKILLKTVLWLAGIIVVLLIAVQVILSPKVLTPIVLKYTDYFLDANVSFKRVGVRVFGHLPDISVVIDSCVITYPSERFGQYTKSPESIRSSRIGTCIDWTLTPEESAQADLSGKFDTLATMASFSATVNPFALLKEWKLNIRQIDIDAIRLYAHRYDTAAVNWDILQNITFSDEDEDTTGGAAIPVPEIGKIVFSGKQFLLYSDETKNTADVFYLDYFDLTGNLESGNDITKDFKIHADSIFALHITKTDSILFGLDRLDLSSARENGLDVSLAAEYTYASKKDGRSFLPINLDLNVDFIEDTIWRFDILDLHGNVGMLPIAFKGEIALPSDSLYLNASLDIQDSPAGAFFTKYREAFTDQLAELGTDAMLTLHLETEGYLVYSPLKLPPFSASVRIPDSKFSWGDEKLAVVDLDVIAVNNAKGRIDVNLRNLSTTSPDGSYAKISGKAFNILGKDPKLDICAKLDANLQPWSDAFGSDTTFRFSGHIFTQLDADFKLSQLSFEHFADADISCILKADNLKFRMPGVINAASDGLSVYLGAVANTQYEGIAKGARVLEGNLSIDTASAKLPDGLSFGIGALASKWHENAAMLDTSSDSFYAYYIDLNLGSAAMSDQDGTRLGVSGFNNFVKVTPDEQRESVPVFNISSQISDAALTGEYGRMSVDSIALKLEAVKHDNSITVKNPKDARQQKNEAELEDALKYFYREWDNQGYARIGHADIKSTLFPMHPSIDGFDFRFSNDVLNLKKLNAALGSNNLHIDGRISNIKNALLYDGTLKAELNLSAGHLDLNELLAGFSLQEERYKELHPDDIASVEETTDVDTAVAIPYFEVPDLVDAKLRVSGEDVTFSNIRIDSLATEVVMKDKCIQISHINASANLGELSFEGFYSTKSKNDIAAGINFGLSKVTAAEVIDLIPSIDTLLPMLQSFEGILQCQIAGTTQLDTNLNFILPTTTGILRIGGDSLHIEQSDALKKATKLLMFKDNTEMNIHRMNVEASISDGQLEVFPFLIAVDRYKLALAGQQNMDQSFNYHISVIKSPLPFRLGLNIYGTDFDHLKFKLVKPKFKSEETIPVFSTAIDETCYNLSDIISNIFSRNLEDALNDKELMKAIEAKKKSLSGQTTEEEFEEFSPEELAKFEEQAREGN